MEQGREALQSKKLPNAFRFVLAGGKIIGIGKSNRDLLTAHQEGHIFSARHRAANQQFLSFSRGGRLVSEKKLYSKAGKLKRGVFQRFAGAHTVGQRVLPQRKIVPDGQLTGIWLDAVTTGALAGFARWSERVQ